MKSAAMFRPVFVPKYVIVTHCIQIVLIISAYRRARETVAKREAEALESEAAIRKRELEAEERRKQSHDMVAESIMRELAESASNNMFPMVSLLIHLQRRPKNISQTSTTRMGLIPLPNSRRGDSVNSDVLSATKKRRFDAKKSVRKSSDAELYQKKCA